MRTQDQIPETISRALFQGHSLGDVLCLKKSHEESIYGAGYRLYESGNIRDSVKVFRFLGLLDPLNKKYLFALGVCEKALGQYRAAIDLFSLSALLDINDQRSFFQIGQCYLSLKELDKAHSAFRTVIHFEGKHSECNSDLKRRAEKMREECEKRLSEGVEA